MTPQCHQQTWGTQFPILILDRAELQQHLNCTEVESLTDEDMAAIATTIKQDIEDNGIWDEIAFLARSVLTERKAKHGA